MTTFLFAYTQDECRLKLQIVLCLSQGENGSNDFANHHIHIHEPDPNPHRFNQHVHPAVPHLYEQLEHEPYQPHYWIPHRRHWAFQPDHYHKMNGDGDDEYSEDKNGGKGDINKHIDIDGRLREHQHSQDHDENRLVFINPHLRHYGMCEGI